MLTRQTFAAQQSTNRRNSVLLIGLVTLLLAALGATPAASQTWPSRPVTMIVP